jgi:hypothetical protein
MVESDDSKLFTMRKPLMMKKKSTAILPMLTCPWLQTRNGSLVKKFAVP